MKLTYQYLNPEEIIESDDFKIVEAFLRDTGRSHIGWHYIVDLTWIYSRAVNWPRGSRVLDAGGGRGPAQFLLAEMGFDVTNIDLVHTKPDYTFFRRYGTQRKTLKSYIETRYVEHIMGFGRYRQLLKRSWKAVVESAMFREMSASAYAKRHENWRVLAGFSEQKVGSIDWLAGNLCDVPEMDAGAFDAVISLSSLEHIPLEILPSALAEIQRMVRPDGYWAVTTSATEQHDTWYHEQSLGYCFSESDIGSLFNASSQSPVKPAEIMHLYKKSQYLKENLAFHYRLSGNNGMPWGKWDPSYIPVGFSENKVVL